MLIVDANECEPCSVDVRYCNAAGFACGSHGCRCDDVVHNGQPNDSEDEESTMDDTSAASAMEAFTTMLDALHKLHSTLGKQKHSCSDSTDSLHVTSSKSPTELYFLSVGLQNLIESVKKSGEREQAKRSDDRDSRSRAWSFLLAMHTKLAARHG